MIISANPFRRSAHMFVKKYFILAFDRPDTLIESRLWLIFSAKTARRVLPVSLKLNFQTHDTREWSVIRHLPNRNNNNFENTIGMYLAEKTGLRYRDSVRRSLVRCREGSFQRRRSVGKLIFCCNHFTFKNF